MNGEQGVDRGRERGRSFAGSSLSQAVESTQETSLEQGCTSVHIFTDTTRQHTTRLHTLRNPSYYSRKTSMSTWTDVTEPMGRVET